MPSAWAKAWGGAWGVSWGQIEVVVPPLVDAGPGGPDVFDAPYRERVRRIKANALKRPEIDVALPAMPEAREPIVIPDTSRSAELAEGVAQAQIEVARMISGAQAAARETKQVVSRAAKRSIQRAARREALRIENEDAEAIAIALALLED